METVTAPPRTPSPKVRIRAQSFDSPSSRISVTPVEESPFSKSTIAIKTFVRHDVLEATEHDEMKPVSVLLPLNTKMSDESMLSDTSSVASSSTDSDGGIHLTCGSPSPSPSPRTEPERQRPHPLTFHQSTNYKETTPIEHPSSPFLYQDKNYPMYSPWLVRAVLDLHDVRGLNWMSIAGPVERIWGVRTSTAEVLAILSDNGRVNNRRWWD